MRLVAQNQTSSPVDKTASTNLVVKIMQAARQHAIAHGDRYSPAISPSEQLLLGENAAIDVSQFRHADNAPMIVWTVDDPAHMKILIEDRVEGIISDRPDVLQHVLREEAQNNDREAAYFKNFDIEAHAGGKGLRPENTLPTYEFALDSGATTIETDTGLTSDGVSVLNHDSSFNPVYCRRNDDKPYADADRVLIKDMTMAEIQKTYTCDKITPGSDQKNDLSLSPVAVAFAKKNSIPQAYTPISVDDLYKFVQFYAEYYKTGAGKDHPEASKRWHTAQKVRFNLEIKIDLRPERRQEAQSAESFVEALCGTIVRHHMEERSDVQSFTFQSLLLVQERYPAIRTVYLFGIVDPRLLKLLPDELTKNISTN